MGNVLTRADLFIQQSQHPTLEKVFLFNRLLSFCLCTCLQYYLPSHNVNKCRVLDLTFPLYMKEIFHSKAVESFRAGCYFFWLLSYNKRFSVYSFFHRVKSSNRFWLLKVNIIFQFLNKCAGGGMGGGVFNALRLLISAPIHFATPF